MKEVNETKEMKKIFKELTEENKQFVFTLAQGMVLAQKEAKS